MNSKKSSLLSEMTEQKIQNEKEKLRCDQMMKQLKSLTLKQESSLEESQAPIKHNVKSNLNPSKQKINENVTDESSSSSSSDDDEYTSGKRIKAPTELKEEFLLCIMRKEWQDAYKLCKFILMYEPHNEEANDFLPLIEYKLSESSDEEEEDVESSDLDDVDSGESCENDDETSDSDEETDE